MYTYFKSLNLARSQFVTSQEETTRKTERTDSPQKTGREKVRKFLVRRNLSIEENPEYSIIKNLKKMYQYFQKKKKDIFFNLSNFKNTILQNANLCNNNK